MLFTYQQVEIGNSFLLFLRLYLLRNSGEKQRKSAAEAPQMCTLTSIRISVKIKIVLFEEKNVEKIKGVYKLTRNLKTRAQGK